MFSSHTRARAAFSSSPPRSSNIRRSRFDKSNNNVVGYSYCSSNAAAATTPSATTMTSYDDNLLTAVSRHPILYDHMRRDYKNSEAKIKAWEDIQKELNIDEPVEKIRQRWKSIRDSYVKYINKTRDRAGSRVRPYKFERQLNFLKPFLAGGQKDGLTQFEDDSRSDDTEPVVNVISAHEDSLEMDPAAMCNKRKRIASAEHFLYENQLETSTMPSEYRFSQMDDIDIFFYGLAQTMKKLRPLTVAKLKKEMANLVTDAEIRELEEVEQCVKSEIFVKS